MVSPSRFPPAEGRRRTSNREAPPYAAPYTHRRTSAYAQNDSRSSTMSERDTTEESTTQRKRIAVACGRCRKRKIRCSGDTGNGVPCLNCKNAGFEPCQFLRVHSTEAPMRNETFSYNLDVSRHFQARGSSMASSLPTPMTPYPEAVQNMPSSETVPYRNGSTFADNSRNYYPVSGWPHGLPEGGNIEYPMYSQPYQQVQEPGYVMSDRVAPSAAAPARPPTSTSMYVESEQNYGYASGHGSAMSLTHRPASNPEPGNLSFQPVIIGLSTSLNSSDRLVPAPPARPLPSTGGQHHHHHPYRAESISSAYSRTSRSSTGSSSPAPLSEAPTSYGSFENSPMTSYTSAAMPQITHPSSETYSTAPASSSESTLPLSLRSLRLTAPEQPYRYTDTTQHYARSYTGHVANSYLCQSHGQTSSYMGSGEDSDRNSSYIGSRDDNDRNPSYEDGREEIERKPTTTMRH